MPPNAENINASFEADVPRYENTSTTLDRTPIIPKRKTIWLMRGRTEGTVVQSTIRWITNTIANHPSPAASPISIMGHSHFAYWRQPATQNKHGPAQFHAGSTPNCRRSPVLVR